MEKQIPFTDYDFWSHLSSGFFVVYCTMLPISAEQITDKSAPFTTYLFWLLTCYIVGHAVAFLASTFIERQLVRNLLESPSRALLGVGRSNSMMKDMNFIFNRLPEVIIEKIRKKANTNISIGTSEEVFLLAYSHTRGLKSVESKLNNFMNQYQFCRNMSAASAICAIVYAFYLIYFSRDEYIVQIMAFFVISMVMFIRYMTYWRHFCREIYVSFAMMEKDSDR